jgi:NitT/TauT family transport system ATP-binding protein
MSDRVLVMSRRPGRIIDEMAVDLPHRDNPIARRHQPKVNDYVDRLMDRLGIEEPQATGMTA